MSERAILVLDEGTTSTRAMLYEPSGKRIDMAQQELTQHYPQPGWVEHDATEIWERTLACAREVIARAGGADRIAAIGITNQRETVVAWDKASGVPLHHAIVWQDRRTADRCAELRAGGHEGAVQETTGLLLDPYFSGTKMAWLMADVPAVREAGDRLAFGTIESWLVWKLTGGLHVSDATNASRTMLMGLETGAWDAGLCDLIGVPRAALPEIVDTSGAIGLTSPDLFGAPIPICGMAGDQQAATIGQGCLAPGETKATYGTGAFVLTATGATRPRSTHRLLATVLHQTGGERGYAIEGSVFVAGSLIKWLRDQLGLLASSAESEAMARSVSDNGGVYLLPALAGLGAPYWRPDVAGAIAGLTLGTTRAHLVRAALESMAHQTHDLMSAFAADGAAWQRLRIDGGMSANGWIAQDLADMLDLPVERAEDVETTARGAAMLAAMGAGLYRGWDDVRAMLAPSQSFTPAMAGAVRAARLAGWRKLVETALTQPAA